jgi:phosphoserine phosphatase
MPPPRPLAHRLTRRAALDLLILGSAAAVGACRQSTSLAPPLRPLSSWTNGPTRDQLLDFTARTTRAGADFIPPDERLAVFDNDGTLWAEKPMPFQFAFALDRMKTLARADLRLAATPAVQAALDGDLALLRERDILAIIAATHAGMTPEDFDRTVRAWLASARHPRFGRPYEQLVYQPQLELLHLLKANGYRVWIVSGGGVDFMRAFASTVYGVPPEQVVGSSAKTRFEQRQGRWVLVKTAEAPVIDDRAGKPSNIELHIGRRPVVAVGNSDGDLDMLRYADAAPRQSLKMFVHHDDAEREYAYDRQDPMQAFDKGWNEAVAKGWTVVSMKRDWNTIFP